MKAVKIVGVLVLVYIAIVALFESLLGYFQPQAEDTLVITTFDAAAQASGKTTTGRERVLSALDSGGKLYVAVNHWPRTWYRRSLANPEVRVTRAGETWNCVAVPVTGEERARVATEHPIPIPLRFLMGFAPRRFLRLDPATDGAAAQPAAQNTY